MSALIELRGVSYKIDGKTILDNISFPVEKGERISIIGPNGAGKSTLLKCIVGIVACGGSILLNGRDISGFTRRERAKMISFVPQGIVGEINFTVMDIMSASRYPYQGAFSFLTKDDSAKIENALNITGMAGFKERMLSTLSGGEMQKVLIASALAQGSELMLLDEPSTFLDPFHKDAVNNIIRNINRELGVTVITVTHDINDAVLSGDRIIALKNGAVVFSDQPDALMKEAVLKAIFDKKFEFIKHPHRDIDIIIPEIGVE